MTSCVRGWPLGSRACKRRRAQLCRQLTTSSSTPHSTTPPACVYRPRRSLLYMPGSSAKMLAKLPALHADSLCLDLEDAVALSAKPAARQHVRAAIEQHSAHFRLASASSTTTAAPASDASFAQPRTPELLVRINPASSAECASDLRLLLECDELPHGVVLPKLESADELRHVFDTLRTHRVLQVGAAQPRRSLALVALVETARGLLNLSATLSAASAASLPLQCLIFGGDDYAADVGATRTSSNAELLTARQLLVAHTAAYRLQSIDIVHIDLSDAAALAAECRQSYGFGFAGKQCIHPKQVGVVEVEYVGGRERVEWSRRVVAGWRQREREGVGAWTLDGKMIDMPTVKNALKVLDHARACGIMIEQ